MVVQHYFVRTYVKSTEAIDIMNERLMDLFLENRVSSKQTNTTPQVVKTALESRGFEKDKMKIGDQRPWVFLNCVARSKIMTEEQSKQ